VTEPSTTTDRWAIKIEYDGTGFVGWQRQNNGVSVQQLIEDAAAKLVGNHPVPSITAGRTDAGVHACGQVIQLDFPLPSTLDARQIRDGITHHLKPHRVVVLEAARPAPDWNARFSATWRSYRYTILNRPSRPALAEGQVWHIRRPLDAAKMHEAARHLLGQHDFSSFRASSCQANSPLRTLDLLTVRRDGQFIIVDTKARSFLHHQVRNMVGSLQMVGYGAWPPEKMAEILAACDRRKAGPTAPPDGLCFMNVGYEPDPFQPLS